MNKIGNKIIQLNVVDSTNNFAANLLKSGEIVHGTVILADEQSAGRGQRGATWQSTGGLNLIFTTFVECDNLTVKNAVALNQWVALSLVHLLESIGIECKIKWPNDIYVGNKKIAGILIENQVLNEAIKSSIIGIGLNVNQQEFGDLNATSIQLIRGERLVIMEVAFKLIAALNNRIQLIEFQEFEKLNNLYHSHLWNINQLVKFTANGTEREGIIEGVTHEGNLRMKVNKEIEIFQLKEISFAIS